MFTGWPKKVSQDQMIKKYIKSYVNEPVNEIIFSRQIKVWIKHHNIIRYISMRDLLSDFNNHAWPAN